MADELTPKLDTDGNPEMDADGNPIMEKKPDQPVLDADGNPVVDADGNPVLEPKTVETTEDLSWLDTRKYGEDKTTAIKKQAQAYPNAVKEMQLALKERDLAKRELELLKASKPAQPQIDPNNIPDEFREQVRLQFGDGVTAEQVIMQQKLLDANLEPLRKDSLNNNWKLLKADLKEDNIFGKYPDLLLQLESLPLAERFNENKIKQLKADFIIEHITEITEQARLDGVQSITGSPPAGQKTESSTKKFGKSEMRKTVLSAENKQYIETHGGDSNEIEEYLNRKPTEKRSGYLQFAE